MDVRRTIGRLCGTIGMAAVLFAGLAALLFVGCSRLLEHTFDPCGNQVVQVIPSPDGKLKAVVFERDCGATTEFSTQVSILPAGDKLLNDGGNLFVADDHGAAPSGPGGGPRVGLAWTAKRQLLLRYDHSARVFKTENRVTVRCGLFGAKTVIARYQ
jgi:hypothetical protein